MVYILLIIFLSANLQSEVVEEYVKIEAMQKVYVKGEPIYFKLERNGVLKEREYYIDGVKCKRRVRAVPDFGLGGDLTNKNEVKATREEYAFPIRNVCDYRIRDMVAGEHEFCYKEGKLKACSDFMIIEPEGIDREVFEKYIKGEYFDIEEELKQYESKLKEELLKFPTSTYAGWALKDYVYKTFDYDEEGRKNEKRKYRDLIETFVNANNDFIFAGSLLSKAAFISLELEEINKACELFDKSLKLKWQVPTMNNKLKEEAIKRSKSAYEKLKKEGKCK